MLDDVLRQAIGVVVGAVVGGTIAWLTANVRQKNEEIAKVKNGLRAQLKNTVRWSCRKSLARGWVEEVEKSDILDCYDAYEALVVKNGVMEDLIARYRALPTEPQNGSK